MRLVSLQMDCYLKGLQKAWHPHGASRQVWLNFSLLSY